MHRNWILNFALVGFITCFLARVFNFGYVSLVTGVFVLPIFYIHVSMQSSIFEYCRKFNINKAPLTSLFSNVFFVVSSVFVPDGLDAGSYAVFSLVSNPPRSYMTISSIFFFLACCFSLYSYWTHREVDT